MGTSVGLVGPISGKIGTMVWYYRNGKQHQRAYISKPNNPKSAAQQSQRVKMALAGQLSKIVFYDAIEGFDGSKTERRSRFLSSVMLGTTVEGGRASIGFGDLVFSEGNQPLLTGHHVDPTPTTTNATRKITISTGYSAGVQIPEGYGERYVALFLNSGTSQFDYAVTGLLRMPTTAGQAVTTTVELAVGDQQAAYVVAVYAYPFVAKADGGTGRGRYSFLGTDEGTIVVDEETGETLGRPELFGGSQFIGSVEAVPPTQSSKSKSAK